jgi:hypothetical protein
MEIELPDGTILDAPDNADPSAVAKAYLAKQKRRRSPLEYASGLASAVNQGMTLGFADEAQAGVEQLLSSASGGRIGAPYRDSLARQKRERESFAADNPWASGLATGAGAVVPSAFTAFAPAAATAGAPGAFQLLRQSLFGGGAPMRPVNTVIDGVREGARAGIVPGFVAGAGTAEPGQRLEGAVTGGVVGGAVGGTVGGTMQGVTNTARRAQPYLQKVIDALNLDPGPPVSRAVPAGPGSRAVAPITAAERRILQAMEDGGVTPEVAAEALRRAREAGVPLGLVDVGGQPILREARAARTLAGEGSAIIDDALLTRAAGKPDDALGLTRTGGQADRVIGQLERGFGRKSTPNAGIRSDALLTRARSDSSPLYAAVDALPPVIDPGQQMSGATVGAVDDPVIRRVMETPFVREKIQAVEAGRASLGRGGAPLYDADGRIARPLTFRDIDMAKQQIDEQLQVIYNAPARPQESAPYASRDFLANLRSLRNELLTAADAVPTSGQVYSTARQSFAGPAQARTAFEMGRTLVGGKSVELADVQAELGAAGPAQRKWMERGFLEAVRGNVDRTPDLTGSRNVLGGFYGNRADRAKVLEVVNPRRRGLLDEALMMENRAAQTRNFVASGSQTADKLAEATDQLAETVTDAATGNKVGMLSRMGDWLRDKVGQNTRAEIARQLTNFDDPAAQQAFLRRLVELRQAGALNAQDVQAVARTMTTQTQTEGQ